MPKCEEGLPGGGVSVDRKHTLVKVVNAGSSRAGVLADTRTRTPDPAMREFAI
jgi:hypothetical protein